MFFRALILVAAMGLTALACVYSPEVQTGEASGVVMKLPLQINGFTGTLGDPDPVEKKLLPEDTEFVKMNYYSTGSDSWTRDAAHCSIVLSGAERKSIHRPEVCLVGQGWTILESKTVPVDMGGGHTLRVQDLYIEKPVTLRDGTRRSLRAHYVYWFIGTDVTTPSHTERIWLTLWDNLSRSVNHRWAYASVMAVVSQGFEPEQLGQRPRDSDETIRMISGIIQQIAPQFQKQFMPHVLAASL